MQSIVILAHVEYDAKIEDILVPFRDGIINSSNFPNSIDINRSGTQFFSFFSLTEDVSTGVFRHYLKDHGWRPANVLEATHFNVKLMQSAESRGAAQIHLPALVLLPVLKIGDVKHIVYLSRYGTGAAMHIGEEPSVVKAGTRILAVRIM